MEVQTALNFPLRLQHYTKANNYTFKFNIKKRELGYRLVEAMLAQYSSLHLFPFVSGTNLYNFLPIIVEVATGPLRYFDESKCL